MTRVVLGPTGGRRRRWTLVAPFFLVALVGLMLTAGAQAVHDDGVFELDRNAIADPAVLGEDWNQVCPASTPVGTAPGCLGGTTAQTSAFQTDDAEIYTGGSTKDDLDIPGWRHTAGSVPDKDELLHGYAARYGNLLYFGADRYANNGDSQIGIWFFQSAVAPQADGTFSGQHLDGDTLVLSDFTKGGETSTIRVFRWNGPGGTIPGQGAIDGTLDLLFGTTAQPQDCVGPPPLGAGDPACATVNAGNTASPWAFTPKTGAANTFAKGEFYEGGIDLADPRLNLGGECFSSVILETRSSQSVDAVLKDFVAAGFEHCGAHITIAPDAVNEVGATHTFTVTVTKTVSGATTGVSGVTPTVTLTGSNGISGSINPSSNTCSSPGTDASGQCKVVFTSSTAGTVTGHATATVVINGTSFPVATGANSTTGGPDAVKQFVDANVSISPSATNEVGTAHTFTITSTASPAGTTASLTSITPSVSPAPTSQSNTCATPTLNGNTATCTLTINNSTAGTFTANATAVWSFSGSGTPSSATVTRDTDPATATTSGTGGSGPATKKFVDAAISISPSATNEVGTAHTFTVTLTGVPGNTGLTPSAFAITGTSVTPAPTSTGGTCPTLSGSGNTRTCTIVINNNAAGTFTAKATGTVTIGGVTMTRDTDSATASIGHGPGGTDEATKKYVDAAISISPSATNEVGTAHTFTVTLTAIPGNTGLSPSAFAITGTNVTPAPGSTGGTCPTLSGSGNTRTCTIVINNSSAGTFTANASGTVTINGVTMSRDTDPATATTSGTGGSGPAVKKYVDAAISIAASAVNEVGHPHTFTVTLTALPGNTGLSPSAFSVSTSVSPTPDSPLGGTCPTLSGSGNTRTCTLIVNNSTAGTFTANASGTVTIDGVAMNRSTSGNSGPGGSGPATKRFVDANITIGPAEDTNTVGDPHTFTVTVQQDDGLPAGAPGDGATGLGPPPLGTQVTVTLTNDATSQYQVISNSCLFPGAGTDANGQCFVVFTSPTAGTVTGNASAQFLVGGVLLTRDTDPSTPATSGPGGSGPAIKHFVAGSIAWRKVDNAGNLQGGATFELCQTHKYDIGTSSFVDIADDCRSVVDNTGQAGYTGLDSDADPGEFKVTGLSLGRYTVHETAAPSGFEADPDTETVELTPGAGNTDKAIGTDFVNSRPILKISGFGYTNEATGTPTAGVLSGTTTFTANLKNYGTADAVLSGSTLEVTSNKTQGTVTCAPSNPLALTGTIAKNGGTGGPYSLTCTYSGLNDGATITATLNVKYTTNGMERTASGSPATITFTVQGD